jgi:hypothetical protein
MGEGAGQSPEPYMVKGWGWPFDVLRVIMVSLSNHSPSPLPC